VTGGGVLTAEDYTIVVPSRKRTHNMPTILNLLPTAIVCVEEVEVPDYVAAGVPRERILSHPPLQGHAPVVNWMLHAIKTPIFIEVDDDFVGVQCTVGSTRKITNPRDILQIIINAAQNCHDLGLGVFCFSRNPNPAMTKPDKKPVVPVQPVSCVFGTMNAARHRLYDVSFPGRAAIDYTLRTLLDDRALYCDNRFYFDFGRIFSGRGGNVGVVTTEQYQRTSEALVKKWGEYLSFKAPGFAKGKRASSPMSIRVSRTNDSAQK
jgi:hypothetical protein